MRNFLSAAIRLAAVVSIAVLAVANIRALGASGLVSGIDTSNLDRTCKPCADFYQFANGGWIKNNPIPPAYPGWGSFNRLDDHNQAVLHEIVEQAAMANAAAGSNEQKVGDFYASCMDTATIDKAGTAPIAPLLDLAASATTANLGETLAALHASGVGAFFNVGPVADRKNSATTIVSLSPGGLGLPDRAYYTRTDQKSKAILAAYQAHIVKMFELLGDAPDAAGAAAGRVIATETALAQGEPTIVERRDPEATYHKVSSDAAAAMGPNLQLAAYLHASGIDATVPVDVTWPSYIQALSSQVAQLSPQALHEYLRWHVVHAYATALPQAFVDENWNFYDKTLRGSQQQLDRWKRCVRATDQDLGEALGQMYVAKVFPPAARAAALEMVKNIEAELRDDFATLSWMTPQTRARAVAKLEAFDLKIGYPDKWRDYGGLTVVRSPYAANRIASARFDTAFENGKIGKPVDRAEWGMTPPTVNAYYNPSVNEIVFPAGILQPPFFNASADMAVNYGGIGAVIGHESTHGFDDEGRKFDATGNLSDWWTATDAARFDARAQCIVNQWDALEPLPGVHEIGKQIEGEEIADLGGLTVAYKAFEKWQARHPRLTIDGFTPEQRFFMGWAQVWASNDRPEYTRLLAQVDVHGYDKFRVNQTLSDMPQFAKAFFCKLGDPMVRPRSQQCQIW